MKHLLTSVIITLTVGTSFAQNIGIGTSTPHAHALLHVDLGTSKSKGFLVTGTTDTGATVPDLGNGSRLMFFPGKAALRAGYVIGDYWNNSNVGFATFAAGRNTIATGDNSIAFGYHTTSTGYYSAASGFYSTATGVAATAMGSSTTASGRYSTAMGFYSMAKGYAATVVGIFNDSILTTDQTVVTSATPLFLVGNGDGLSSRSNALVVRKDGKVGIGNIIPEWRLDVAGRMRIRSGGDAFTTAGVWLSKVDNSGLAGFVGMDGNNHIGFYGQLGAGWGFTMNTTNGNICHSGTIAACSDIRYKTNLLPLSNVLDVLLNLHPVYYHWTKEYAGKGFSEERQIGFSAQEIEQYFPEVVQTNADGYKAVDYSRLTPVLVQAVKEQQKLIEGQNEKITKLIERVALLEASLEQLQRLMGLNSPKQSKH